MNGFSLRTSLRTLLLATVLLQAPAAFAQQAPDGTVLISNGFASISRAEYDAELLRLPIDLRAGFANNPRRVNDLLTRMLVQKSLAVQARAARLQNSPQVAMRIQTETDRLLSQVMLEDIEAAAATEFNANRTQYDARARELFAVERAKYVTPEQVTATHILFDVKKHGADAARKMADDVRARVAAGADMAVLAKELSDDPSAQSNAGKLEWFAKREMDPAFGEAAFALKNPGDLSPPVLSQFGWHVIRLEARRPEVGSTFEQARDTIMSDLRKKYVDEKRDAVVNTLRRDPKTALNREAVDALTPRVDIDAARRALGLTPGGVSPGTAAPK